ncbi:S8 family peptidase [Mobilitalea sibirica]|uniref:S8 family peptidase n=1 Tax=Mobilitalea sibirica TaxID=1462919 RepID=A0A8J7KSW7_9FIRM|nr:S8 family peptidase [Mobilitalea sibirica]MBH1940731.1 S8 family peptidase [Mobilitalea sibirica]
MLEEERARIHSEDYADLIIEYRRNPKLLEGFTDATIHIMNDAFAIVHVPATQITDRTIEQFGFSVIPNLFGLISETSLEASRVDRLRTIPAFDLRGEGVLVGIVDTGIDYTNPVFRREDGTTKVMAIWDQTIDSAQEYPYNYYFGTQYQAEQINQALASENPLEIVPSTDEIGHGTMLASIAAGMDIPEDDFYGVAPEADLVVVKLLPAKMVYRDFFFIPEGVPSYQENKIMWGVQYCIAKARELGRPIAICIGLGTSQEAHDGRSHLSTFLDIVADFSNTAVVVAVGNEGNTGRHFFGIVDPEVGNTRVELNVSENDPNFTMELWGDAPGIFSIDILSPSGEYIPRIPPGLKVSRVISFIFENAVIYLDYQTVESETGDQLIFLRLENMTPGIWQFNVYGQGDLVTAFHIWLPMGEFISNETYFIQPNIYTTILAPGTAMIPISITAYNPLNENLYVNSSRGYTRAGIIKPDLAAPGVNYIAPVLGGGYTAYTGTSVAAAHATGIAAMVLEWGVIRGNQPGMDTTVIKKFLIRGARRRPNLTYPNRDWGYGILDVFNVFDILRGD